MTLLEDILAGLGAGHNDLPLPPELCGTVRGPIYEVEDVGVWRVVNEDIFRCWTGCRRINGKDHHGPVFAQGGDDKTPWTGRRYCSCATCQEHVSLAFRPN